MKIPMREKYVDESIGVWFIFGKHPDGTVDINDGNRDVPAFTGIQREAAQLLCEAHDRFRKEVYKIACNFKEQPK